MSEPINRVEDSFCPVCGYYCLGKGGVGCIDKPGLVKAEKALRESFQQAQWGNSINPC